MYLEPWQWLLGMFGAFLVGVSKTGVPGLGILNVALFALVFPARESIGIVLVILICGDIVAAATYRRDANWQHLWRLFPWAALGVVLGYFALGRIDDVQIRRLIGVVLLALVVLQFVRSRRVSADETRVLPPYLAPLAGITAGFTTMVANAAGPVMVLYLLAMRLPKIAFLGTTAWYFLILNLFKTPFSASLGLINLDSLSLSLFFGIFAIIGALLGRSLVTHINQRLFENSALILTFIAGVTMLR